MTDSNDTTERPGGRANDDHAPNAVDGVQAHDGASHDRPRPAKPRTSRPDGAARGRAPGNNAARPAGPARPGGQDRSGTTGLRRPRAAETRPRDGAPNEAGAVAGERKIRTQQVAPETAAASEERIAKVIARAGIASRRDAEAMILEGRVTLDGRIVASPALNVAPDALITVDGEALPLRERTRLWLFHKPRGLVTTFRDPEGRPTVFEALPDDLPRVVAVGRLDINTEGLLLLTNDGGLARVVAHPDTGWLRRYRVRAHGDSVTQADLDALRHGITIEGIEYGPIEASLDRVQGDNVWITLGLREGKNREVKKILENLGLQVNRLIRLSFGPFQLGDIEPGLVEEVRTRVLKDQLGTKLSADAAVDFDSPVREPIAPFGAPPKADAPPARPRAKTAAEAGRRERGEGRFGARPEREARPSRDERPVRGERPAHGERPDRAAGPDRGARPDRDARAPLRRAVWRADEVESTERPRPIRRRDDPKGERQHNAERAHERVGLIRSNEGRKVVVERLVPEARPEAPPVRRPARDPRTRTDGADARPQRARPGAGTKPGRSDEGRGGERKPGGFKPGGFTANRPAGRDFGQRDQGTPREPRARDGERGPPRSGPGKFGAGKFGDERGGERGARERGAARDGAGKFGGGDRGPGKFGAGKFGAGKFGGGGKPPGRSGPPRAGAPAGGRGGRPAGAGGPKRDR